MSAAAKLEDIVSRTSADIAAEVAEEIRAGRLRSGDRIVYQDLIDRYAVSRATIQRAMVRLDALGLIQYRSGRGVYVR